MVKKIIYILIIICLFMFNIAHATDIIMDLNSNTDSPNTSDEAFDNSINLDIDSAYDDVSSTTTTEYEDPGELSITNMINIILIVVGVVLVLLGIAIIIKLK